MGAQIQGQELMFVPLNDEVRVAEQIYPCDACALWLGRGFTVEDCLDSDEVLTLEAALTDEGCIHPGQQYRYQRCIIVGHMMVFRSRVGMFELCKAHGLFDE